MWNVAQFVKIKEILEVLKLRNALLGLRKGQDKVEAKLFLT